MLTKQLLKFRIRNGRVFPDHLEADDAKVLAVAERLCDLFRASSGLTLGELEEQADDLVQGLLGSAFKKLLLDLCDADNSEDEVFSERRWQWLLESQRQRLKSEGDYSGFQSAMAAATGAKFEDLKSQLYGDLPARRLVQNVPDLAPEALIHRYNLGQIQGLLLRTQSLQVSVRCASVGQRRELLRQLRFRGLFAELKSMDAKDELELRIDGPLSLHDSSSAYGLKLANFFPALLSLPRWRVEAEVNVKNRSCQLQLSEKSGLVSPYQSKTPYIPEEFDAFIGAFNERQTKQKGGWRAEVGGDIVHLGGEAYVVPDVTLRKEDRAVPVELFHKWHRGAWQKRINLLESISNSDLIVGVAKALAQQAEGRALLANSPWFDKNGFIFSDFPTPRAIETLLERRP